MRNLLKLTSVMAALVLSLSLAACEVDDEGSDAVGGTDVAQGADTAQTDPCAVPCDDCPSADMCADDNCDQSLFFDIDCQGMADDTFTFACGKDKCDFTEGKCDAIRPCGAIVMWGDVAVAKPCPNDPDCEDLIMPGLLNEPPIACGTDGHCDTWCAVDTDGQSIDPDCGAGEGGDYCPGGSKASQCE